MRVAQQSLHASAHVACAHELSGAKRNGERNQRDVVLAGRKLIEVVLLCRRRGYVAFMFRCQCLEFRDTLLRRIVFERRYFVEMEDPGKKEEKDVSI